MTTREGNLIIEFGSSWSKAGVADYTTLPISTFPTSVELDGQLVRPIVHGLIKDWSALSVLCKKIISEHLHIEKFRSENQVLVAVPTEWNRFELEQLAQIFFENLDVPGLAIVDQSLLALYSCGLTTGLVIDIGYETCSVTPVFDSIVSTASRQCIPLGRKNVEEYLKKMLSDSNIYLQGLAIEDVANAIKNSDHFQVLINSDIPEEAISSVLLETISVNDKTIKVPKEVFWKPMSVLFYPDLSNQAISLQEAIYNALNTNIEPERRPYLSENVVLTGGLAEVKGIRDRIEFELAPYLAASETSHEFQPKDIKFSKIPEYMTSYKDAYSQLTYLGATVAAKILFMDSRNYITRNEYKQSGPSVIHTK